VISCPHKGCNERISYRFGSPVCPKHGLVSFTTRRGMPTDDEILEAASEAIRDPKPTRRSRKGARHE